MFFHGKKLIFLLDYKIARWKNQLNTMESMDFQFDGRKKKLWVECCFSNAPPSKATTGRGTIGTLIASSRKLCANLGESGIWQNSKRHSDVYVGNDSVFILVTAGRRGSMSWANSYCNYLCWSSYLCLLLGSVCWMFHPWNDYAARQQRDVCKKICAYYS